jgi:heme/copper-type cytochrome/quinol oxidase subunit 3
VIPSQVLAMLIFVATEAMFFSGLVSAFLIGKSAAIGWPPPGQPRAPAAATAVTTLALLLSGVALYLSERAMARGASAVTARRWLQTALALGSAFIALQGYEWTRLVWFGLTVTSSVYGSFFYLIVGTHAAHAVAAVAVLVWATLRLEARTLSRETFWGVQVLWYFVVGIWPILYVLVYLL